MKKINDEIIFTKQYDTKIDVNKFINIINSGIEFFSPFEDKNSYLNSYSYSKKSKEQIIVVFSFITYRNVIIKMVNQIDMVKFI